MQYSQNYDKVQEELIQQKFAKSLFKTINKLEKEKKEKQNVDSNRKGN